MLADGIEWLRKPGFEPEPPDRLGPYTPVTKRQSSEFVGKILVGNSFRRTSQIVDR